MTTLQLVVLLPLAAVLGIADPVRAWSVLAGGMIAIIPHLYFAVYAFRYRGATSAVRVARSFYRGEAGKFILTLLGFATLFAFAPQVQGGWVFAGYGCMWLLQLVLVARFARKL